MRPIAFVCLLPCLPLLCAGAAPAPAVVSHVDLGRYAGTWYEIAAIPQPFEQGCIGSQATYTLNAAGGVDVVNSCHRGSAYGPVSQVRGTARVADSETNAKLVVTFDLPTGSQQGDYWILAVDGSYQEALVGTPDRSALWILDRSPPPSAAVVARLTDKAVALGYDAGDLMLSPQP